MPLFGTLKALSEVQEFQGQSEWSVDGYFGESDENFFVDRRIFYKIGHCYCIWRIIRGNELQQFHISVSQVSKKRCRCVNRKWLTRTSIIIISSFPLSVDKCSHRNTEFL